MRLENGVAGPDSGYNRQAVAVGVYHFRDQGGDFRLYVELGTHVREKVVMIDRRLVLQRPVKVVIRAHLLYHDLVEINVDSLNPLRIQLLDEKLRNTVAFALFDRVIVADEERHLRRHSLPRQKIL